MAQTEAQKVAARKWAAKNPDKIREYAKAARARKIEKEPEVVAEWNRQSKARQLARETCQILQAHVDELADDPERLTTDFIRSLVFGDEEESE